MDYNALAQQLIDAVTKSSNDQVTSLGSQRQNNASDIMNKANANGTLYSTQPAFQKTRYDANTYEPAVAAAKLAPLTTKLSTLSQASDIARTIDSMNKAATQLNGMTFDY